MTEHSGPIRILCVDDEKNILQALERSFLDDDYEIVSASSGAEGLQALEGSGPFQVVISDYRMPVMNGVEFLKNVFGRWPDTVRLVLSGYADVGAIVAAINEGHIYKFIPKPWNDEELRLTIQKSLEHYNLQEKHRQLQAELNAASRALEFSRSLLGSLPAGMLAIDENGMIAYYNNRAARLLNIGGRDPAAANETVSCPAALDSLVGQVRRENSIAVEIEISGVRHKVLGCSTTRCGREAVILLLLEAGI